MSEENLYAPPESNLEVPIYESVENELASRWMRFWGVCIDALISIVILGPIMYFSGFWERVMSDSLSISETVGFALAGFVVSFLVNGYLLATKGQTVGKLLVGTKIVSVETNEIIPLWKVYLLRYVPMFLAAQVPVIGSLISMADGLFVFRKDKRCIHDLIAGTQVVKSR